MLSIYLPRGRKEAGEVVTARLPSTVCRASAGTPSARIGSGSTPYHSFRALGGFISTFKNSECCLKTRQYFSPKRRVQYCSRAGGGLVPDWPGVCTGRPRGVHRCTKLNFWGKKFGGLPRKVEFGGFAPTDFCIFANFFSKKKCRNGIWGRGADFSSHPDRPTV